MVDSNTNTPDGAASEINRRGDVLKRLRAWMVDRDLTAFILPGSDPHHSEYTPRRFQARAYVSGFTGSAGTVIITADHAGLWTDSRYFLEAAEALRGSEFELHPVRTPGGTDYPHWLSGELPRGSRIGVDPRLVTAAWHDRISALLAPRGTALVPTDDPFQLLWPDRPELPAEPVWPLDTRLTGESAHRRLERIRTVMNDRGASSHVITTLDDIAWTLNLRGSDVSFNPVFLAYLIVYTPGDVVLYTDRSRITERAREALDAAGVRLYDYSRFELDLSELPDPILLDRERTSWAVTTALSGKTIEVEEPQPSTAMKAVKTRTELAGLQNALIRDGVAMVRFLAWLDRRVAAEGGTAEGGRERQPAAANGPGGVRADPASIGERPDTKPTEATLAEKLQGLRAEDELYISDSFPCISGLDGNGAIVHYSVSRETAATLDTPAVYLIDSGAQYRDGTTDITRTVALDPTGGHALAGRFPSLREDFTLVLKGHIALAQLIFPAATPGREIDALARLPLWSRFRNYGHGTGHGVGFCLNVHEGPQKIAPGARDYPLEAGMLCSNEPGLYRTGAYGIRTENLVVIQPAPCTAAGEESEFGPFLCFQTLTLCPIDRKLISWPLMSEGERLWLDRYHRRVYEALAEHLDEDDRLWLENATAPSPAYR